MASTDSSGDPTDLRTVSNTDSTDVSEGCVRQSSTYIHVIDLNVRDQPLPDVVSGNSREPEDHYTTIGSLQRDNMGYTKSRSETLTSEDMASGQSVTPYIVFKHFQQSLSLQRAPVTRQWCSWKRCMFIGLLVAVIIVLLSALISLAVLISNPAEQKTGDVTLPTSQPTFPANTTMDVSTSSTSTTSQISVFNSTTSQISDSTSTTSQISDSTSTTSKISDSTSTASTTTPPSVSSTTQPSTTSEGCTRKCISCTSHNKRCPANGMIVEGDPGEVIVCPCQTACYSDVRYDDGSTVHRGCTDVYPAWDSASSSNLTCREIDRHFLCFCLEDRCNKEDMTSHIA